jgi:hypothetical protein
MLERIENVPDGVIGVRARGKVTRADYRQTMEPLFDEIRSGGRRVRFVYHFGPDFESFTGGAALLDMRMAIQYLRLLDRCAIVSDVGWIRKASRLAAQMTPCPVRVFANEDWSEAIAWVRTASEGAVLEHRLIADKGVLVLEPSYRLRAEDFDAVTATVDPWIERQGKLSGVIVHARDFPGWKNLGGALSHVRFIRDHQRNIDRLAVVADGKIAALGPRLLKRFVKPELKQFPYDKMDDAIAWASRETPAGP